MAELQKYVQYVVVRNLSCRYFLICDFKIQAFLSKRHFPSCCHQLTSLLLHCPFLCLWKIHFFFSNYVHPDCKEAVKIIFQSITFSCFLALHLPLFPFFWSTKEKWDTFSFEAFNGLILTPSMTPQIQHWAPDSRLSAWWQLHHPLALTRKSWCFLPHCHLT